ncbi:MAG TPA: dipeptidase [Rectinema sp.]|nr:dipeptidase [Rectinema sp.]
MLNNNNQDDFYVIDAHCDTLMAITGRSMNKEERNPRDFFADNTSVHLDFPKLVRGRVVCQVMAIFLEDSQLQEATSETMAMIDSFESLLKFAPKEFFLAKDGADVHRALETKSVCAILSIEGAEALGDSLESLDIFYQRGVRAVGLTWNRRNAFGRGLKAEGSDGLTSLGKELVEKMEEMHVLVDVAHLGEEGFWDVADISTGPFVASHANARGILDHPRNLSDSQIRAIADHGGAIGCVFVPYFVTKDPKDCSLEAFLLHIDHIVRIGGIESCAIGSDFDGFLPQEGKVIQDAGEFPLLYSALRRHGYSHEAAQKILGRNWLRIFDDVFGSI